MTDVTGSVSTMSGAESNQYNTNDDAKETPKAMNFDKDARGMEGGGQYPNYWSHKTRSGHNFIMDDSKGNETITIQHRSGSAIQFRPDGGVHYTTHNGKYEVVFGENRITVSGAQDITVKGDASLRVYGNHNVTVHKDYNLTVLGNMNVTSKNLNRSIRGNMDTTAKNINKRVEGSSTYNSGGAHSVVSKGNMTVASRGAQTFLAGSKGLHASVPNQGNMTFKNEKGDMHMETKQGKFDAKFSADQGGSQVVSLTAKDGTFTTQAKQDINHEAQSGKYQVKAAQQVGIQSESSNIQVKAASGSIQQVAGQSYTATAGASMDMRAPSGAATFAGQSTNINSLGGILSMVSQGAGINLDALSGLLNLNGGIGSIMSAAQQLSFVFDQIQGAEGIPKITAERADQPTEEPDASGEISSWQ
jgi:hypothetical protein